jgi:hypothetical protein
MSTRQQRPRAGTGAATVEPRDTHGVSIGASWLWCLAGCAAFWWLVAYLVERVV